MQQRNGATFRNLTTERLTLRQLTLSDAEAIFALRSNAEVNKYLDRKASKTIGDAVNFIHAVNEKINGGESFYWAIAMTGKAQELVGTVCLFDFSSQDNSCEIGFELSVNFQRQGIMREALLTVINFCFKEIQLEVIKAFVHKNNQRSIKILEQMGFEKKEKTMADASNLMVYELSLLAALG